MSAIAENPVRQHFYEGMFLVDSGKYATDPESVTGEIMTVLAKAGATVVAPPTMSRAVNWRMKSRG